MAQVELAARPPAYEFAVHEEGDLRETLLDIDQNTVVSPIGALQDILLNPDTGQTINGYKYTDVAIAQLAAVLAPGLQQLVLDLYGQWRRPGEDKRFYSPSQAIEIFNRVARLRFEKKLVGMQIIRDVRNKTIDGLIGVRYRYLPNSDFLDRIVQTYVGTRVKFFEAYLYGRQMAVRYLFQESEGIARVIEGDSYIPGFHFANAEIGGKSVRTANLLCLSGTRYCALSQFKEGAGGRIIHSGKSFDRRLQQLLSTMAHRMPVGLPDNSILLTKKQLHLGGVMHDKNVKHIISMLRRKKLNLGVAKRVVASAAARGRYETDSLADKMPDERRLVLKERTGYDLFVALIREARGLPLDQREIAEQVAYGLITGSISI